MAKWYVSMLGLRYLLSLTNLPRMGNLPCSTNLSSVFLTVYHKAITSYPCRLWRGRNV